MQIAYCVICSDNFEISSNISATKCGHTFHETCLFKWLKQSKSCPTCRVPAKKNEVIKKLYFDVPSEDLPASQVDPAFLKNEIERYKLELSNKDAEIDKLNRSKESLESTLQIANESNENLQVVNRTLEIDVARMKSQIRVLKKESQNYLSIQKRCEELQNQLQLMKNIQTAVDNSSEEINLLLNSYTHKNDISSLATLCALLKKELHATNDKRRKLKDNVDDLGRHNNEIVKELAALNAKYKLKEEDLAYSERERKSLEKKIQILQCSSAESQQLVLESPAPLKRKDIDNSNCSVVSEPTPSPVRKAKKRFIVADPTCHRLAATSENLPQNMSTFTLFKKKRVNPGMTPGFLMSYKPKVSSSDGGLKSGLSHVYDGLGGHKRFNNAATDCLHKKLDKNKNVERPKRQRVKSDDSFMQLDISNQLINLE